MYNRWQEAERRLEQSPAPPRQLLTYQEMGGHVRRPDVDEQAPPSTAMTDPQGPPVLLTPLNQPTHLGATGSPQVPQLTSHHSASETSQETVGREESMESDSQAESDSQDQ